MIFYSHGCGNVLQVKKRKSLFCFWKTFNNIEYIWKLYNIYVLVLIANTNDMFFFHIFPIILFFGKTRRLLLQMLKDYKQRKQQNIIESFVFAKKHITT